MVAVRDEPPAENAKYVIFSVVIYSIVLKMNDYLDC